MVLAGVSVSLMLKSALDSDNRELLKYKKIVLFKRALFLFVGYKSHWLWIVALVMIYPMLLEVV